MPGRAVADCLPVGASIVDAPVPTRNEERARNPDAFDPEGSSEALRHEGPRLRGREDGLTHGAGTAPANRSDVEMAGALPRSGDERVSGDAGRREAGGARKATS